MPSSVSGKSLFAVDVEFRPADSSITTTHEDADNTPFFDPVNPSFTFNTAAQPQAAAPIRRGFVLDMKNAEKIPETDSPEQKAFTPDGVQTFLGLTFGSKIKAKAKGAPYESIAEAISHAAVEIRTLAQALYKNYEELQTTDTMLPEAGVTIYARTITRGQITNTKYTYTHIDVGKVEYQRGWTPEGTTEFTFPLSPPLFKKAGIVGRVHMHWINLEPSRDDVRTAKDLESMLQNANVADFKLFIANWNSEKVYLDIHAKAQ